jgi:hypothetical protein
LRKDAIQKEKMENLQNMDIVYIAPKIETPPEKKKEEDISA